MISPVKKNDEKMLIIMDTLFTNKSWYLLITKLSGCKLIVHNNLNLIKSCILYSFQKNTKNKGKN